MSQEAAEKWFGIQMKNSNENMKFNLEKLEVSYVNRIDESSENSSQKMGPPQAQGISKQEKALNDVFDSL